MSQEQTYIQSNGTARTVYENGQEWTEPLIMPWEALRATNYADYADIREMFAQDQEE